ncbi:MAG: Transcriptional regulator, TrmB [uncultured bacterium (gcode 4)]|uniref:Transcriptional regulator, TrmB n=1 Tax=uncultured bacterium (gcode 4) TaxID=1234023 RepID=K1XJ59_9BACT|nr:MAG: Transcriptional regulator, TrmB [uncultured bacterium (gcode 4)]
MENTSILKQLGFTDQEVDIYLSLLQLGGSQASSVAKDIGVKRTTVYHTLRQMASKGYVTVYFRKNRRYFYAQKPSRLAALYSKKLDNLYAILPQLQSLEKKNVGMVGLRFIETQEELKEFYTGVLDEYRDKEYLVIGSAQGWEGTDPEWFHQYRVNRGRHNIRTRLLLTDESKQINPDDSTLLRDVRYLPEKYSFRSTIDIFDDKILVVSSELSSLAVLIEISVMRDVFGAVFDVMWDMVGWHVPWDWVKCGCFIWNKIDPIVSRQNRDQPVAGIYLKTP